MKKSLLDSTSHFSTKSFATRGLFSLAVLIAVFCVVTNTTFAQSVRKVEILSSPLGNASSGEVAVVNSSGLVYTAGQAFGSNYGVIDPNTNSLIKVIRPADLNNQNTVFFSRVNQPTNLVYFLRGSTQIDVVDGRTSSATFNQLLPSLTFANQTIAAFTIDQTRNRIYVSTLVTGSNPVQSNVLTIDADPGSPTFHQILTTTPLPAGQRIGNLAVNTATNKVYIASILSGGGVFVLSNSTQSLIKIPSTIQTSVIIVNETSNTIYAGLNGTFANGTSQIQAIDGVDDTLTTNINIPGGITGNFGELGAVNSVTERVYMSLSNGSLSVIDAKRSSPTFNTVTGNIPNIGTGGAVEVSEELNKIVVASGSSFDTLIIDGATNTITATVKGNMSSADVTINPLTGRAFAGYTFYTTQNINLNDNSAVNIGTIYEIGDGLVNPNNNLFYFPSSSAVTGIGFLNQNDSLGSISGLPNTFGRYIFSAQNKTTNRLYFVNSGANIAGTMSRGNGFVTVVDGATNNVITNVEVGGQPFSNPAVNETTNKIYQMNVGWGGAFPSKISVINGTTNTASDVDTSAFPANTFFIRDPVVNPTTNKIYFRVGDGATTVGVINGATDIATPLAGFSGVVDIKVNPTLNRVYFLTLTGLRVLNGADDTEIANIALSSPSNLTINQTTGKIYVQQFNQTRTLSVIDPNSNMIITTVPLDNGGFMRINETTNELYVTQTTDFNNESASSILFINGDSLAIRKNLPVPIRAGRIYINPATQTAYITTVNASQRSGIVVISTVVKPSLFDFDGDRRSDISVFRPSDNTWYLNRSTSGFTALQWGESTDKLAPADYDGDGKTDVAVWRPSNGNFYIFNSSDLSVRIENFGLSGDIVTSGDWDGDGKADLSVYRDAASGNQSFFYYRGSLNNPSGNVTYVPWGNTGDKPVVGDFDGDGKQDSAVFRPSNNTWYINRSSDGQLFALNFGLANDKLVPADYDGDGRTDIAVFRDGTWYIQQSSNNQIRYENFGLSSDTLSPADYDGDGRADIAVFRDGTWYIQQSTSELLITQFGLTNDKPIPNAYIP